MWVHEIFFSIVLPCILSTSSYCLLLLLGPYNFCPFFQLCCALKSIFSITEALLNAWLIPSSKFNSLSKYCCTPGIVCVYMCPNFTELVHMTFTLERVTPLSRKRNLFYQIGRENIKHMYSVYQYILLNFGKVVWVYITSVQFSHSVMSESLRSHGLQHTRLPCSSPAWEPAQTHVRRVGDVIQLSHPLSCPYLPSFNHLQHYGLSKKSVLCTRWPKFG